MDSEGEGSLDVVDVLAVLQPLVGEVGGEGVGLALQHCILGHVERGVPRGDEDDGRTLCFRRRRASV